MKTAIGLTLGAAALAVAIIASWDQLEAYFILQPTLPMWALWFISAGSFVLGMIVPTVLLWKRWLPEAIRKLTLQVLGD